MKLFSACLVCCCLFFLTCRSLEPVETSVKHYSVLKEKQPESDSMLVVFLAPYKAQLEEKMNVVLGEAAIELTKSTPESTLGNWAADAMHRKCETTFGESLDFAIVNYGGLRISQVLAGPVTKGKIFELMPFDNTLVLLDLDAATVQRLFDRMADYGGWPISYPVRYEIVAGKAQNIKINGVGLQADRRYKIGVSDFIANGGSDCEFLVGQTRRTSPKLLRDIFMETVAEEWAAGRQITAEVEGRISNQ